MHRKDSKALPIIVLPSLGKAVGMLKVKFLESALPPSDAVKLTCNYVGLMAPVLAAEGIVIQAVEL
jgi:hypothetical protein